MMSETYVECLVKRKKSTGMTCLKFLTVVAAVIFVLLGFLTFLWPLLIVGALFGVGAYFASLNADLEYEYLYLDKEITIDKIMAKTKRKRAAKYDVDRMEIFAPIKSHHLDAYKNRKGKTIDYSSGEERQQDPRYVMYYEGGIAVILEPNEDMVKAIKNVAPRKVFTD